MLLKLTWIKQVTPTVLTETLDWDSKDFLSIRATKDPALIALGGATLPSEVSFWSINITLTFAETIAEINAKLGL